MHEGEGKRGSIKVQVGHLDSRLSPPYDSAGVEAHIRVQCNAVNLNLLEQTCAVFTLGGVRRQRNSRRVDWESERLPLFGKRR